jgi:hypothetical protein
LQSALTEKRDLVPIQWFAVIACAYLLVVQDGRIAQDPVSLLMLLGASGIHVDFSAPSASRVHPPLLFSPHRSSIPFSFLRLSSSTVKVRGIFGVFFRRLDCGERREFLQVIGGCLIAGVLSVVIISVSTGASFSVDVNMLLRIPLLFGSSLLKSVYNWFSAARPGLKNPTRLSDNLNVVNDYLTAA